MYTCILRVHYPASQGSNAAEVSVNQMDKKQIDDRVRRVGDKLPAHAEEIVYKTLAEIMGEISLKAFGTPLHG